MKIWGKINFVAGLACGWLCGEWYQGKLGRIGMFVLGFCAMSMILSAYKHWQEIKNR